MRMALQNLWSRKASSFKVILSMTIMIAILCIFVTYTIALEEKTNELVYSYRSGHYYSVQTEEPLSQVTKDNIGTIDNINNVTNYSVYSPVHDIFDIEYIVDGESCKCYHSEYRQGKVPANASALEIVFHRGELGFYDNNTKFIAPNDELEANYRWNNPTFMQSGSADIGDNEMVVSTEFLREFGLGNDIVGKTISIKVNKKAYDGIKVIGVLGKKFFQLTGNVESPQVMISNNSQIFAELKDKAQMNYRSEIHINDYMNAKKVANKLVEVAGISDFKIGSSYGLAVASTVTMVNMVLVGVISTVGLGIIIALLLNIIFSTQFLITKKSNYYGMIRAYGATNAKVFGILFCEILVLSSMSVVFAYGLSYGLAFVLQAALSTMLGIGVEFTPLNFGVTFISALVFSIGLLLIVTIINYVTAIRSNITHLLRRSIDS